MNARTSTNRVSKSGWGILLTINALLVLNGALLYVVVVTTPQEQTLSILLTGFGALAVMVAVEGFRHGSRWAWHANWVVVAVLAVVGLHMLRVERVDVGTWYLALTAVALMGQFLARRGLAPSSHAEQLRVPPFTQTDRP